MKFMIMMIPRVYQPDTPASERAGDNFAPPADAIAKMMKFNEELTKAGALVALDGLHPVAKGARVSFGRGEPKVTDGPFIESKEVIGGYWIIEAKSKQEAIDWMKRCPAAPGDVIEIRQVFAMEDFPAETRSAAENSPVRAAVEGRKN
jgi:hypothetical protein